MRFLGALLIIAVSATACSGKEDAPVAAESRWELDLTAENAAWEPSEVARADQGEFLIKITNEDEVPHNIHLFLAGSPSTANFQSPDVPPGEERTFSAGFSPCAPCEFVFRCEIHPDTMVGTVKAQQSE